MLQSNIFGVKYPFELNESKLVPAMYENLCLTNKLSFLNVFRSQCKSFSEQDGTNVIPITPLNVLLGRTT